MFTEQDRQFGIHFLRNRGTSVTAAALAATTPATATPATAPASASAAPGAGYRLDYEIGGFAFLRSHNGFRSGHAALRGLELISCLHFVQQRRGALVDQRRKGGRLLLAVVDISPQNAGGADD